MDSTFYTEQRAFLVTLIANLRTAILLVSTKVRASYSIDTGQTKETVTVANLTQFKNMLNSAISELEEIDEILNGGGDPVMSRPAW